MENFWDKPNKKLNELLDGNRHVFYSVDEPMDKVAIVGTVVLMAKHDEFWGEGKDYLSEPVTNPTWLDLAILADEAIVATGDYHHQFFEGVAPNGKGISGNTVYEFFMGS